MTRLIRHAVLPAIAVLTLSSTAALAALPPAGSENATTVHLSEMRPRGTVAPAPRIGVSPSAPRSEQNASSVPVGELLRNPSRAPAPRIGISPSAPDSAHDATTVN